VAGDGVRLVDSASSVAERVARDLESAGLRAPAGNPAAGDLHAYVTDTADRFARLARQIVGDGVSFELVDVT
jgi:glutamate racemase